MARINIDDDFLVRQKHIKIAKGIDGMTEAEAFMHCALLWRNSQHDEKEQGSLEEIIDWADIDSDEIGKEFVEVLCSRKIGLLEKLSNKKFRIRGNKKHIEKLQKLRNSAKRGGAATRKKWENKKKDAEPKEGQSDSQKEAEWPTKRQAETMPNARPNTIQSNTIQNNTNKQATNVAVCNYPVADELKGDSELEKIISEFCPMKVQERWLKNEDPELVKQCLSDCVSYWLSRSNGEPIQDWGVKFFRSLQRARGLRNKNQFSPQTLQGADSNQPPPEHICEDGTPSIEWLMQQQKLRSVK